MKGDFKSIWSRSTLEENMRHGFQCKKVLTETMSYCHIQDQKTEARPSQSQSHNLPGSVWSCVGLYANDTVINNTADDRAKLQEELHALETWEKKWNSMLLNASILSSAESEV